MPARYLIRWALAVGRWALAVGRKISIVLFDHKKILIIALHQIFLTGIFF